MKEGMDMGEFPNAPPEMQIPEYVSYSSYDGWLQCPKRHQLQRLMQLKEDPAWWTFGGSGLHSSAEELDHRRYEREKQ